MKNKKILQIVSMIMFFVVVSSTTVFAEAGENEIEENAYSDTDQFPYVCDIDEYLSQLNAGLITPSNNTTITTYESTITPFGIISDPSKSCSNIFGHKWSDCAHFG